MNKSKSVLKREAVQQEQVNSGHFLELMDRLHVVICILEDHIKGHSVTEKEPEIGNLIEMAQEKLSEAYCLVGKAENAMLSAYKPQAVLSGQGLVIEMPQVDDVLEQAAQAIDSLASSGENKDDWTITRDLAFHRASEAVRSLIVKPQSDDMRKDAERWRTFREIASEEMCYALCGNSNADNDELDQAVDKIRE